MEDIELVVDESIGGATPVKKGKRWLVTIAKPGTGQMGTYPEATLRNFGATAFPPGTKSFFNHDSKRDARDIVGTFKEGAFWNEDEGELQGVLTPYPRYADVLEEAQEAIEASMHVLSRKGPDGIVKELMSHRANTVDLVGFGGLEGSGLKFQMESLNELFAAASAVGEDERKEENMEITKEMWDGLVAQNTGLASKFDTFVSERLQEKQGVADADAVAAAVTVQVEEALTAYAEKETAINAALIPTVQKEALKVKARLGADISGELADAVSFTAESLKEFGNAKVDPSGKVVVVEESLDNDFNPSMGGNW